MKINIKKLAPDAGMPSYATPGAACFDLRCLEHGYIDEVGSPNFIFSTGLAFEIPKGHVMLVFSRSGHGFNHDVRLANCVGVIDSDYRGEVKVKLSADNYGLLQTKPGDRIAQAMILPCEQVQFEFSDDLSSTQRGDGGFGSSGK